MILNFTLSIDTTNGSFTITNNDTNQTECVKTKKKSKTAIEDDDTDTVPKLILQENKYFLNKAARELMNVKYGDRLAIVYEEVGKEMKPIIGTIFPDGNKLTKTYTVPCKGVCREELQKYGTEFKVLKHPKDGLFYLDYNNSMTIIDDENIEIPDTPVETFMTDDELFAILEEPKDVEGPMHALDFTL